MTTYDWEVNKSRWTKSISTALKKEMKFYPDFSLSPESQDYLETQFYNVWSHLCSRLEAVPESKEDAVDAIKAVFPSNVSAWVTTETSKVCESIQTKSKQHAHIKTLIDTMMFQLNKFVCPDAPASELAVATMVSGILIVFKDILKATVTYCDKLGLREISIDTVNIIINAGVFSAMFTECERAAGFQLKVKMTYSQLINDILHAEKAFSTQLDIVLKIFVDSLEAEYGIDSDVTQSIFQNIAKLKDISTTMAIGLEDAIDKASIHKTYAIVTHIFEEFASVKDYEQYRLYGFGVNAALGALNTLIGDQAFFDKLCINNHNFAMAMKFELPYLLLAPVYHFKHLALSIELLLEKVRKNEDPFVHAGSQALGEALSVINPAADSVSLDEASPLQDNRPTALELGSFVKAAATRSQQRLLSAIYGISDSDAFLLRSPLIHAGQVCVNGKQRYGFLLNTHLVLCKENSSVKKLRFTFHRFVTVSTAHVYFIPKPGTNQIEFKTEGKTETLSAKTPEELQAWTRAICRVASANFVKQELKTRLAQLDTTLADLLPPPEAYGFTVPDLPENIRYTESSNNALGRDIKGGTLQKLVEHLSSPHYLDLLYVTQFLLTYRNFCTPEELLDLLIQRQNVPIEHLDGKPIERRRFEKLFRIPVIVQVLNVIRIWVDKHFYDFQDGLTRKVLVFVKGLLQADRRHERQCNAIVRCIKAHLKPRQHDISIEYSEPPPEILRMPGDASHQHILDFHPVELARQLTLIDSRFYRAIHASELVDAAWTKDDRNERSPNVIRHMQHFNQVSNWVRRAIMEMKNIKERAYVLNHFMEMFLQLRSFNNFSSLMAFHAALRSSGVIRLKKTWAMLSPRYATVLEDFEEELGGQNYPGLRAMHACAEPPCVPFLGIYQTDIVKAEDDSIPNFLPKVENDEATRKGSDLINFSKRRQVARACIAIERFQNRSYNFSPDAAIQNFVLESPVVIESPFTVPTDTSSAALNAFEDALYQQSLVLEPRSGDVPDFPPFYEDQKLLQEQRDALHAKLKRKSTKSAKQAVGKDAETGAAPPKRLSFLRRSSLLTARENATGPIQHAHHTPPQSPTSAQQRTASTSSTTSSSASNRNRSGSHLSQTTNSSDVHDGDADQTSAC